MKQITRETTIKKIQALEKDTVSLIMNLPQLKRYDILKAYIALCDRFSDAFLDVYYLSKEGVWEDGYYHKLEKIRDEFIKIR